MIIEWYGLKILAIGLFLGWKIRSIIYSYNKTKAYEIHSFNPQQDRKPK